MQAPLGQIPGYTGHRSTVEQADKPGNAQRKANIPGYAGYIPGVASENCYGVTYFKSTEQSANGTLARGIDQPANIKYQSSANQEFVHHIAD